MGTGISKKSEIPGSDLLSVKQVKWRWLITLLTWSLTNGTENQLHHLPFTKAHTSHSDYARYVSSIVDYKLLLSTWLITCCTGQADGVYQQ